MAALTGDRKTPTAVRGPREFPVGAGLVIYEGAIVAVDASGWARPGRSGTASDRVVGRAELRADNTGGANGAIRVRVRCDEVAYYLNNGTNAVTQADLGQPVYVVDDQTVSTLNTNARAGKVHNIDSASSLVGVWFDQ